MNKNICIIPGLYFKSFQEHTEGRIPFEIFGIISLVESFKFYCNIVDFNIKAENRALTNGKIIFAKLDLNSYFYNNAATLLNETKSSIFIFFVSVHTNGNYFHSIKISQQLKKFNPSAIIIFAGLGPSSSDIYTLQNFKHVDVIIRGESEKTTYILLDEIAKIKNFKGKIAEIFPLLDNLPNITYIDINRKIIRNPDCTLIENLDSLPFPTYAYYGDAIKSITNYTTQINNHSVEENIHIEAGRGCPFSCEFCSNKYFWKQKIRFKSQERIISEIKFCVENYGAKKFLLHHQLFTMNKMYILKFCELLINSKLNIQWSCFTRSEFVDSEILEKMSLSGCKTVLYGIESGSQRLLNLIGKKSRLEDVIKQIDLTIKQNIKPQLSFIIGFPDETKDDLQKTLDMYFNYKFLENVDAQIGLLAPVGGTAILNKYNDLLEFDGIGTTTWYTRFFEQNSFNEIAAYPKVFPQNFYFKTRNMSREMLKFIKVFDIISSYFMKTVKYIILSKNINVPFEIFHLYSDWKVTHHSIKRSYQSSGTLLQWDTNILDLIVELHDFLKEAIIPKLPHSELIRNLLDYEFHFSIINNTAREIFYNSYCTSAVKSIKTRGSIYFSRKIEFRSDYKMMDIINFIDEYSVNHNAIIPAKNETFYQFKVLSATHIEIREQNQKQIYTEIRSVFNQVEY